MNVSAFAIAVAATLLAASIAVFIYIVAFRPAQPPPPSPTPPPTATARPTAPATSAAPTTPAQSPGLKILNVTLYVARGDLPGMGGWWNYTYVVWAAARGPVSPSELDNFQLANGMPLRSYLRDFRVVGNGTANGTVKLVLSLASRSPLGTDLVYGGSRHTPQVLNASYVGTVEIYVDGQLRTVTVGGLAFPDRPIRIQLGPLGQGTYQVKVEPSSLTVRPRTVNASSAIEIWLPNTSQRLDTIRVNVTRAG